MDATTLDPPVYTTDQIASTTFFTGKIRLDHFGRVVIDTCPSDEAHLQHSVAKPGDDRARCRRLVESAFDDLIGLEGDVTVTIEFKRKETAPAPPQST